MPTQIKMAALLTIIVMHFIPLGYFAAKITRREHVNLAAYGCISIFLYDDDLGIICEMLGLASVSRYFPSLLGVDDTTFFVTILLVGIAPLPVLSRRTVRDPPGTIR